jgi:hypothetical protein
MTAQYIYDSTYETEERMNQSAAVDDARSAIYGECAAEGLIVETNQTVEGLVKTVTITYVNEAAFYEHMNRVKAVPVAITDDGFTCGNYRLVQDDGTTITFED